MLYVKLLQNLDAPLISTRLAIRIIQHQLLLYNIFPKPPKKPILSPIYTQICIFFTPKNLILNQICESESRFNPTLSIERKFSTVILNIKQFFILGSQQKYTLTPVFNGDSSYRFFIRCPMIFS